MKIILADDHALFREGMRHVLPRLDTTVEILEAANWDEALAFAERDPEVDLALVDLNMPGRRGLDGVRMFQTRFPAVPVVVLSASDAFPDVKSVLDAGALGYIPKSSTSKVMISALKLVLSGGVYLPPVMLNPGESVRPGRPTSGRMATAGDRQLGFTDRQLDVLNALAAGKSNKTIARELDLAEGTIKVHIAAIFRALGVSNRTEAVLEAQRLKICGD